MLYLHTFAPQKAKRCLQVLLIGILTTNLCYAANKPGAAKRSNPKAAPATASTGLELVTLDEMRLGPASSKTAPAKKKEVAAADKDSLDGLLNHATRSEPPKASAATKKRMHFPDEKQKLAAAPPEKTEVVAPDRVTSEVTAKALAAATADANKKSKIVPAAANVPKLPPKMKLNDDPLAGMSEKEQRSHAPSKGPKKPLKEGF